MVEEINYQELRRIQNDEREKRSLQKIDPDFFAQVKRYVNEKNNMLRKMDEKKDNMFSKNSIIRTKKEIENTEQIVRDIIERREKKILLKALIDSRADIKNEGDLLECEKKMYVGCYKILKSFRHEIANNKSKRELKINLLSEIPKFKLGEDIFGPFKMNEIIKVPKKIAEMLINSKKAKLADA
jgi:DNA replication initiation complex subunit (GINS family)